MELLGGLFELEWLGNMLWLAVSVPLLLALCGATYLGSRRSLAAASSVGCVPEVSRLGRPALIAALTVVASVCLSAAAVAWATAAADAGSSVIAPLVVAIVLVAITDIASALLFALLVALARDVLTEGRVPGRGALLAYATVTAAHAALLGICVASGLYSSLVLR